MDVGAEDTEEWCGSLFQFASHTITLYIQNPPQLIHTDTATEASQHFSSLRPGDTGKTHYIYTQTLRPVTRDERWRK